MDHAKRWEVCFKCNHLFPIPSERSDGDTDQYPLGLGGHWSSACSALMKSSQFFDETAWTPLNLPLIYGFIMLYRIFFLNSFDFMCVVDGLIVYLNGSSVFILSMMIPSTFAHVSGLFSRMAIGDQLPRCDAHRSPLRGWVGDDPVRGDLNPHNWRKTRID